MLRTGDVLLASFPYSDQSGSKRRPVVLIDKFKEDLLVAYFTREVAKYSNETTAVLISQEDISEGRIKATSVIRLHKLAVIEVKLCKWVARIGVKKIDEILRKMAAVLTKAHFEGVHKPSSSFVPGKSRIPYAGRVYDEKEMINLVDSALDFWLTTGRFAAGFEREFAKFLDVRHVVLCNSGSSANLLAISSLTSPKLNDKRLKPGDEVITLATGFPTTVNPIIQNQLVPVFVDVSIPTYNVDVSQLEEALSERTRAVFLAHTLGNPFDVGAVFSFCQRHDLWLIEDCCDALGSTYTPLTSDLRPLTSGLCGSFGHLSTFSFYPAHHITMGEGGALATSDNELKRLIESFRDWGRDCWCPPGHDNTCKKRFEWQLGDLPYGYDHKYTYSHVGYNLKLTDMQAAVGLAQLRKLPGFVNARKRNFQMLYEALRDLEDFFILPEATPKSDPSWFGFPLAVRTEAPFTRDSLIRHLDQHKISTRLLFGGNLTRQPAYKDVRYRKIGDLRNSDFVMNQVFWIGVYRGLTEPMLDYIIENFKSFTSRMGGCQ